jgi:hypothetical protein
MELSLPSTCTFAPLSIGIAESPGKAIVRDKEYWVTELPEI